MMMTILWKLTELFSKVVSAGRSEPIGAAGGTAETSHLARGSARLGGTVVLFSHVIDGLDGGGSGTTNVQTEAYNEYCSFHHIPHVKPGN